MSLLEDVFLQDETEEAQDLERIIEGDDYDGRGHSDDDDDPKEDKAEEDKRRVDPTKPKNVVKNPRFVLNPARLTGPRGIHVIPDHFKDFKFKGKGHEKEDLDIVLKKLEHWAYRLYPKFQFEDCLKKIETLGKKRTVMVHLHKIRSDQFMSEETVVQKDSSDEEPEQPQQVDEFDILLQQQIEIAQSTPAPNSAKKPVFNTPIDKMPSLIMPKATSSPSISEEQKERMLRNRRIAEQRRLQRLNVNNTSANVITNDVDKTVDTMNKVNDSSIKVGGISRLNVTSSDESDNETVNHSVSVEIHTKVADASEGIDDFNRDNNINESSKNKDVSVVKHKKSNVILSDDDNSNTADKIDELNSIDDDQIVSNDIEMIDSDCNVSEGNVNSEELDTESILSVMNDDEVLKQSSVTDSHKDIDEFNDVVVE